MSKILSFMALPLGILIVLKYFRIYDLSAIINLNVTLIGAVFLVIIQIFSYIMVHTSNQGTTLMGKIIKTILAASGVF